MMRILPILLSIVSLIIRIKSQVTIAKNTQVTPRCGSQLISIEINFDPTQLPDGKFTDWIVVGVSGRPECRLRGNGETKYIIEIAVFNDPCLTQIPARNVFQNRIRIGKNPVVILEGDQSVTVKCVYGLPTVETLAMPVINPNFNIDNLGGSNSGSASVINSNLESSLSSNINPIENLGSTNQGGFQSMNEKNGQSTDQFLLPQVDEPRGEANIVASQSSTDDLVKEINEGKSTESLSNSNRFTSNPIRPQIPIRLGNEDFQPGTVFPTVTNVPEQTDSFGGFNSPVSNRKTSFSIIFILGIIFLIIFILLCLFCLYFFLRRRREERNRRLLIDGVSSDEGRKPETRSWFTDNSTDGYASPGTGQSDSVSTERNIRPARSATATIFDKRNTRGESREVPIPSLTMRKNTSDVSHFSKSRQSQNNRQSSTSTKPSSKKLPAPQPPKATLPLRSNLEEFVSKTYAMGEYNDLASPAYAYTSEIYDEREVDIGFGTAKSMKLKKKTRSEEDRVANDDGAVSSYRSITEIVHAAETTNISREVVKSSESNNEIEKVLIDSVIPIRGFGYRKLTEQEMGRWKNLIQRDSNLRDLIVASKSVAEIEEIFERDDFKNMFSSTKWHEIAQCVHRALTSSLDRTNSQSQLQLFVGNMHSDW